MFGLNEKQAYKVRLLIKSGLTFAAALKAVIGRQQTQYFFKAKRPPIRRSLKTCFPQPSQYDIPFSQGKRYRKGTHIADDTSIYTIANDPSYLITSKERLTRYVIQDQKGNLYNAVVPVSEFPNLAAKQINASGQGRSIVIKNPKVPFAQHAQAKIHASVLSTSTTASNGKWEVQNYYITTDDGVDLKNGFVRGVWGIDAATQMMTYLPTGYFFAKGNKT